VALVSMKELLEAGVHFGHRSRRWHPKMRSFIFTERNGIHIIDLQQTISRLDIAYNFVRDTVAQGGVLLFVGTKKQAQDNIREQAVRCGMPYVVNRWLGGTLTNFRTIQERIDYMLALEDQQQRGEFNRLTKMEALVKERELTKLDRRFGGIRNLKGLPDVVFIVDIHRETNAVKEASRLELPIVAMVDTNCDPDPIEYIVPANDDAIRAIKLMASKFADAVIEGQQMRSAMMAEESAAAEAAYLADISADLEATDLDSAPRVFEPDAVTPLDEFEFVEAEDEMEAATDEAVTVELPAEPRIFEPDAEETASEPEAVAETETEEPAADAE
jgi:small subunit ribosomal protein S2